MKEVAIQLLRKRYGVAWLVVVSTSCLVFVHPCMLTSSGFGVVLPAPSDVLYHMLVPIVFPIAQTRAN